MCLHYSAPSRETFIKLDKDGICCYVGWGFKIFCRHMLYLMLYGSLTGYRGFARLISLAELLSAVVVMVFQNQTYMYISNIFLNYYIVCEWNNSIQHGNACLNIHLVLNWCYRPKHRILYLGGDVPQGPDPVGCPYFLDQGFKWRIQWNLANCDCLRIKTTSDKDHAPAMPELHLQCFTLVISERRLLTWLLVWTLKTRLWQSHGWS